MVEDKETDMGGNWRAVVVNNNDPLRKGRIKARVFGLYDDLSENDIPWAEYADPFMGGGRESGGTIIPDEGDKVWVFFEANDPAQPVYFAGAPSMLDMASEISDGYPKNRVYKTKSGNMVRISDADGEEVIGVYHKSGTFTEYKPDGSVTEVVTGNYNQTVMGNSSKLVMGNDTTSVKGNSGLSVTGDVKISTPSQLSIMSGDILKLHAAAVVDISGSRVQLNQSGVSIEMVGGELVPTEAYAPTVENAAELIRAAGGNAPWDEPTDTIPDGWPTPEANDSVEVPTEITEQGAITPPLSVDCEPITSVDYNYKISENFTIGSLTTKPLYKHPLKAQVGLSITDIVCNMKGLATNILEPLRAKYPDIHINSGFRVGTGSSQHNKGMAVDIQVSGWPPKKYTEVVRWIVTSGMNYDQVIIEHANSVWIHISYDRTKTKQRNMKLTYYPRNTPNYKPGLINYYDNKTVIT